MRPTRGIEREKLRHAGLFCDAPKRTRTSTRLARTRPSTLSPGCQMRPDRAPASRTSGFLGGVDVPDDLDVAADVATGADPLRTDEQVQIRAPRRPGIRHGAGFVVRCALPSSA